MTFTITSWNIQNASIKSLTTWDGKSSGFGEYVGSLLARDNPAIVGLVEVRGGTGGQFVTTLVTHVNQVSVAAGLGGGWQGRESSQQDDTGRRESSAYLWNSNLAAPSTTAMPGPFFNVNVIDANASENVFALGGVNADPDKQAIVTWLTATAQPWTQFQYKPRNETRLRIEAANWLGTNASLPATSGLPAPPNNSSAADYATAWYNTLKGIDYVLFTTLGDRSPFVGQLTAPGGGPILTVALMHAPEPTNVRVGSAINAMSQSWQLQNATTLVIAGDFNIKRGNIDAEYATYARSATDWKATGAFQIPFDQLTSAPFSATRQMNWTDTSLSSNCPTALATAADARSEPYDLFLTKGATATATYAACDLIAAAVAPANLLEHDMVRYAQQSLESAVLFDQMYEEISCWFDDKRDTIQRRLIPVRKAIGSLQTKVNDLQAITAPTSVQQMRLASAQAKLAVKQEQSAGLTNWSTTCDDLEGKLAGAPGPYTVAMAWMLIEWGVSDHLPIIATGV